MKRNIGLRFVLTDPEDLQVCHPVGRVHAVFIEELRRMVEVFDHIDEIPEGYEIEIQAVRRKIPQGLTERLTKIFARRRGFNS